MPTPSPSPTPTKVSTALLGDLLGQIEKVIFGKPDIIRQAVIALLARGHILLEDVPGTGKTSLARALARSIGGTCVGGSSCSRERMCCGRPDPIGWKS